MKGMRKSKGGRPRQLHNKTRTVAVRLTEREYEALAQSAAGRPVSTTLRTLAFAAQKHQRPNNNVANQERWQELGSLSESLSVLIRTITKHNDPRWALTLAILNRVLTALEETRIDLIKQAAP
ncbi:hypothetical protein BVC71_13560 [Marivivens niveibacter]|uniref:Mobilization protein n=1 Tax=Marivivens niveibacter TaxID=1930667 RepID=A0A251WVK9_9RHOB|nr:hypothetical protein [Marivivens niveibacter]OUD08520.1 hypothetical protein BVC71_13560 [Marivivens niveibacter]